MTYDLYLKCCCGSEMGVGVVGSMERVALISSFNEVHSDCRSSRAMRALAGGHDSTGPDEPEEHVLPYLPTCKWLSNECDNAWHRGHRPQTKCPDCAWFCEDASSGTHSQELET